MQRDQLVHLVCAGYCSFYKPEKDAELACNGFSIVQKLIGRYGALASEKKGEYPDSASEHDLFIAVCKHCSFLEKDCDFASWKRGESPGASRSDVKPCGGILFLTGAIGRGSIDMQTIIAEIDCSAVNHS